SWRARRGRVETQRARAGPAAEPLRAPEAAGAGRPPAGQVPARGARTRSGGRSAGAGARRRRRSSPLRTPGATVGAGFRRRLSPDPDRFDLVGAHRQTRSRRGHPGLLPLPVRGAVMTAAPRTLAARIAACLWAAPVAAHAEPP